MNRTPPGLEAELERSRRDLWARARSLPAPALAEALRVLDAADLALREGSQDEAFQLLLGMGLVRRLSGGTRL